MQPVVEFLGHTISAEGRSVNHAKASSLLTWPEPTCVSALRQLLGVFGFWRQYILHYAEIVAPLTPLTSKHAVWQWTAVHQAALQKLRAALLATPVLRYPDMSRDFFVVTDSSDFAVGASLEQETRKGQRSLLPFSPTNSIRLSPNIPHMNVTYWPLFWLFVLGVLCC
jgi:hypothetical protein